MTKAERFFQVRTSVFETNSSSTHSISIARGSTGLMGTLPVEEDGSVHLTGDDFGWEEETYRDPLSKANYLAIYVRDWVEGHLQGHFKEVFEDVIRDQTGCETIVHPGEGEGYIDHQSVEGQDYHWLFESTEDLRNFIFHPASLLVTDNDNH